MPLINKIHIYYNAQYCVEFHHTCIMVSNIVVRIVIHICIMYIHGLWRIHLNRMSAQVFGYLYMLFGLICLWVGFRVQMYEINLMLAQHLFFIELSLALFLSPSFFFLFVRRFDDLNESSKLFLFFFHFRIEVHGTHRFSYREWKERKINKYINTFCSRLQTDTFSRYLFPQFIQTHELFKSY